jgi:hypothetical protein
VVPDLGPFSFRRLGCADIHAAVDQHRVGVDDLRMLSFRCIAPRQASRKAGLADCSCANEHDGHVHSVA